MILFEKFYFLSTGAAIGIIGTSLNNYLRMRELRGIVSDSAEGGHELRYLLIMFYSHHVNAKGKPTSPVGYAVNFYQLMANIKEKLSPAFTWCKP